MCEFGHNLTLMDQTDDKFSKWDKGTKKWADLIFISGRPVQFIWAHGPTIPFEQRLCTWYVDRCGNPLVNCLIILNYQ